MGELLIIAGGNFAEVYFLGRIDSAAVAAYGAVAPLILFCIVFLRLSAQGATAVLARYRGRGDPTLVRESQRLVMVASLALGLVLASGLALFRVSIIDLLGVTGDAAEYAQQYALGWALVLLLMSVRFPIGAFGASYGNTRWALVANIAGTTVALGLNVVLGPVIRASAEPALGVALAVAVGYAVSLVVLAVLARPSYVRMTPVVGRQHSRAGVLRDMARVIVPGTLDPVQFNLLLIMLTALVVSFGTEHLGARAYGAQIGAFVFMYSMALAQAGQIVLSRAFGAGDVEAARRGLIAARRRAVGGSLVISAVVAAVAAGGGMRLLSDDPDVVTLAVQLLLVGLLLEPGRAMNITTNFALVSVGDGRFVLAVGIALSWLVALPLAFALGVGLHLGVVGVWLAMAFDECLRALICAARWRHLDLGRLRAAVPDGADRECATVTTSEEA